MFDATQIELSALPSVTLDQRRDLPACQGIYFVMDGARVLYVGKAGNIGSRWRNHHRLYALRQLPGISIAWLQFDGDEQLLTQIEDACIVYFDPPMNWSAVQGRQVVRTVSFPAGLYQRLEEAAQREERPVSELVLEAVRKLLKEKESGNSEAVLVAQ